MDGLTRIFLLSMAMSGCFGIANARDLGSFGQVYPIEEPSLLEVITDGFAAMEETGRLDALRAEATRRVKSRVERPRGLLIPRATTPRVFDIDLSITVERDLADHRGQVFARAGTRINPLDHSRFSKRIVMIDGDDPDQVAFALKDGDEIDTLLVIVSGAPLELMRAHGRRFFFDQHGVLAERFQIAALPSVITRVDPLMRVEEVVLERRVEGRAGQ